MLVVDRQTDIETNVADAGQWRRTRLNIENIATSTGQLPDVVQIRAALELVRVGSATRSPEKSVAAQQVQCRMPDTLLELPSAYIHRLRRKTHERHLDDIHQYTEIFTGDG